MAVYWHCAEDDEEQGDQCSVCHPNSSGKHVSLLWNTISPAFHSHCCSQTKIPQIYCWQQKHRNRLTIQIYKKQTKTFFKSENLSQCQAFWKRMKHCKLFLQTWRSPRFQRDLSEFSFLPAFSLPQSCISQLYLKKIAAINAFTVLHTWIFVKFRTFSACLWEDIACVGTLSRGEVYYMS